MKLYDMKRLLKLIFTTKLVGGVVASVLIFIGYGVMPIKAYVPVDCTVGDCGGACEDWQVCQSGSAGNYCADSTSCGPTPTLAENPTPTPVPIGGGGTTIDGGSSTTTSSCADVGGACVNAAACTFPATNLGTYDCGTQVCCSGGGGGSACDDNNPADDWKCVDAYVPGSWTYAPIQTSYDPNGIRLTWTDTSCGGFVQNDLGETQYKAGCWKSLEIYRDDPNKPENLVETLGQVGYSFDVLDTKADKNVGHIYYVKNATDIPGDGQSGCTQPPVGCQNAFAYSPPTCSINNLTVSPNPVEACYLDGSTNKTTYTLNWSTQNASFANAITVYYHNGTDFVSDGFNPASPLSVTTTSTSITLDPPSGTGYNFAVCCNGGNKEGDYGCQQVSSVDDSVYKDVGAPNTPQVYTPEYDPLSNEVTFRWAWTGDNANCATGICSQYEGPVSYCAGGAPIGSYSSFCSGCASPFWWQLVRTSTGDVIQSNNNAQSYAIQSCSPYSGETLRLDVKSKDARGNASGVASQTYVCPTHTPTPTQTPIPTPASGVNCTQAHVEDASGQPITEIVGNVGDTYTVIYRLDSYSTDWTPGLRYQFNQLTGGAASTFCASGTNSCRLSGTIEAGQDSIWFFANLKNDLDPDGDGVYETYRCQWDGTWTTPPGPPPNTENQCLNLCEVQVAFVTPTPTATPTPTPATCYDTVDCPNPDEICVSGACATPTPTLGPGTPSPTPTVVVGTPTPTLAPQSGAVSGSVYLTKADGSQTGLLGARVMLLDPATGGVHSNYDNFTVNCFSKKDPYLNEWYAWGVDSGYENYQCQIERVNDVDGDNSLSYRLYVNIPASNPNGDYGAGQWWNCTTGAIPDSDPDGNAAYPDLYDPDNGGLFVGGRLTCDAFTSGVNKDMPIMIYPKYISYSGNGGQIRPGVYNLSVPPVDLPTETSTQNAFRLSAPGGWSVLIKAQTIPGYEGPSPLSRGATLSTGSYL